MKKKIISIIITFLLLINLFPSTFVDISYANPVGLIAYSHLGNSLEHKNMSWMFGQQYGSGSAAVRFLVDLNNEWIYGDGTTGYKIAANVYSIPENVTWAFPRYLRNTSNQVREASFGAVSGIIYVTRIDGKATIHTGGTQDLPAETIFAVPRNYNDTSGSNNWFIDTIVGFDGEGSTSIIRNINNWTTISEDLTGFIVTRFGFYSGNSTAYREIDINVHYQYNTKPFVDHVKGYNQHFLIDLNGNTTVSPIGNTEATAKAQIFHRGNANVTQHGHVWSTSPNPTINLATKTQLGTRNSGEFTSKMTGLSPGTTYYVRPYATNSYGTTYGREDKFTTLPRGTRGYQYNYIGKTQTFPVPSGINEVNITLKGPSAPPNAYYTGEEEIPGGTGAGTATIYDVGPPAFGGVMTAKMNVIPGQTLNINVGGMNGWNGGGRGIVARLSDVPDQELAIENIPYNADINTFDIRNTGAGATDIRINGNSLEDRIAVVGGGGAGYNYGYHSSGRGTYYGRGGAGAGIPGDSGGDASNVIGNVIAEGGKGGTQQNGGTTSFGIDGTLGQGGHSIGNTSRRFGYSGGGGGYYGGGGGEARLPSGNFGEAYAGGGGGSAFLSSMLQFITGQNGAHYGHGQVIIEIPNKPPTITNLQPNGTIIHKGNDVNITWNDNDPDGDPLSRTIKIETIDGQLLYEGNPAGENNHSLNTSSLLLNWNASNNRYERGIEVTVKVDDLYGGVVERTSQFTLINYRPSFEISTQQGTHNISDTFALSGKVWDSNRDNVTIAATLNGQTKTTTINNSPSSKPTADNWQFTWTGLGEGAYNNINITVTDDKGSSQTFIWYGTVIVKDVLKIIDEKIQENILPNTDNKTRLIVANTNVQIHENATNNQTINSIKSNASNRDSQLFFVGQRDATRNYIQNRLTDHYGNYGESYVDNIISLILAMNNTKDSNVFQVGDFIDMDMLFVDTEKDYAGISMEDKLKSNEELQQLEETLETIIMRAKDGTLQAKYLHDPSIFDHPAALHPKGNTEWRVVQDIEDDFIINRAESNMRGEWTLTMKGSDDTGKPLFDKYSNEETLTFIIHEKPKALINHWEDSNNFYLTGENSYDRDYQYRENFPNGSTNDNQGIIRYQWHYQLENGTWHNYQEGKRVTMPKFISGNRVTGYGLTVTDFHGATDTTRETNIIEPELRAKLYPELSNFNLISPGIPASEEIKVIDIETIPFATDRIEFALYQEGTRRTPLRTLNNPSGLLMSDITFHQWRDIRNYQIPATLPDGLYTAKIVAPKSDLGITLSKEWPVKVETPINLKGYINNVDANALVFIDENNELLATTSKYVSSVTVNMLNKDINMTLHVNNGETKTWKANIIPDPDTNEVTDVATFKATIPSGKTETKLVTFETILPLSITGTVEPTPVLAGYWVTIKGFTQGYAESVTATIKGTAYPMTPQSDTTNKTNTWELKYQTWEFEPDGSIPVYLRAFRGGKTADTTVHIIIEGSYLEQRRARIRY